MTPPAITRCLIGGALGDSLGLPAEGLSAGRISRLWKGPWKHRFFAGIGMVSDDTEHAVMTTRCLLAHACPTAFSRALGWQLRWWFAGIPAGIGLATARSILKLWLGFPPHRSGVHSAGNGPLMRAPVIGVHFHQNPGKRREFIDASTQITHTDPRAIECAQMIAEAAAWAVDGLAIPTDLISRLQGLATSSEMQYRLSLLVQHLEKQSSVGEFANQFGRKHDFVSGFAPDTTAVALYAWLRYRGNFRNIITSTILAGGDTDTVAFVAGSLAGIETSPEQLPQEWIEGLRDFPICPKSLLRIHNSVPFLFPNWPLSLVRNAGFFLVVILHALRRAFPPY